MRLVPTLLALAALLAILDPLRCSDRAAPDCARVRLEIGDRVGTLVVEIADNPFERARGLGGRHEIPLDGMLFVYHVPRAVTFTMSGMLVPIDIAFVNDQGTVLSVQHAVEPIGSTTLPSPGPIAFVLELPSGTARAFGIVPGAVIRNLVPVPCIRRTMR